MSKFETPITTSGPGSNIGEIVGKARVFMQHLEVPRIEIDALTARVAAAPSYREACAIVKEWFPLSPDPTEEE